MSRTLATLVPPHLQKEYHRLISRRGSEQFDRDRALYPVLAIVIASYYGLFAITGGIFDFIHANLIPNPGVPAWWLGFCLTYDIATAGYLASILRSRLEARHARPSNTESL
jgi:hypothetical protein